MFDGINLTSQFKLLLGHRKLFSRGLLFECPGGWFLLMERRGISDITSGTIDGKENMGLPQNIGEFIPFNQQKWEMYIVIILVSISPG